MATNKTLRRISSGGAQVDLHPATVVANIYKDSDENARSAFSLNLFLKQNPVINPAFMKIGTDGSISWTYDPHDFGAAASGHAHAMGDITTPHLTSILGSIMPTVQSDYTNASAEFRRIIYESNSDFINNQPTGAVLAAYIYKYFKDDILAFSTGHGVIRIDYTMGGTTHYAYYIFTDPVSVIDGPLLSDHLADNVGGKAPLGEGNVVPDTYWPAFTQGKMVFKGTTSLSAGTTPANAVNLSTVFTDFSVEPEKKLGSFYIVSVAGYVKADGITDSGTEFIHATIEGPIWMSVGDRIIFAEYISGATPRYKFALLHHDFQIATPTLAGIMSFSLLSNITNRGSLLGTSQGLAVVTEAHVRNAMRDIVYVDNVPEVAIPTAVAVLGHAYVATAVITGEPTHTTGTVSGAYILGLEDAVDTNAYVVFSTGRCYKAVTIGIGIAINWEYVSTITVPNVPAGSLARCAGTQNYMLVTLATPNVFVYTITDFLEGDIIIGN